MNNEFVCLQILRLPNLQVFRALVTVEGHAEVSAQFREGLFCTALKELLLHGLPASPRPPPLPLDLLLRHAPQLSIVRVMHLGASSFSAQNTENPIKSNQFPRGYVFHFFAFS